MLPVSTLSYRQAVYISHQNARGQRKIKGEMMPTMIAITSKIAGVASESRVPDEQ